MLSLYEIQEVLKTGDLSTVEDQPISEWVIDTRRISSPTHAIFVALSGRVRDGHDFVQEAYDRGIRFFLLAQKSQLPEDAVAFIVDDTLAAMHQLAGTVRQKYQGTLIGITGSNGKTIFKEWLAYSLSYQYSVYRSPKSYNSQIGVAISLLEMDLNTDYALIEAGISEASEMSKLQQIILPDVGVLTSIGDAHAEGFDTIKDKIREKCILFSECDIVHVGMIHQDSHRDLVLDILTAQGVKEVYRVDGIQSHKSAEKSSIKYMNADYDIPFTDDASIELSALLYSVLTRPDALLNPPTEYMAGLPPVSMRLEFLDGIHGCKIINDSYSSDIQSIKIALATLENQADEWKKSVILSELDEQKADHDYPNDIIVLLRRYQFDRVVLLGPRWKDFSYDDVKSEMHFYDSTPELLNQISSLNLDKEYILVKGARKYHLETLVDVLKLKKHSVTLEINLNSLRHNMLHYKSLLQASTKIMVMVKSNSYGAGEYEVAKNLQNWGVDYLGVAYTDEGVALRRRGINTPIMVMNPEIEGLDLALEWNLEVEVYNERILDALIDTATRKGLTRVPIHIKLDTGMHRLGWTDANIKNLIQRLKTFSFLDVKSTFTHLYAADMAEGVTWVANQVDLFGKYVKNLKENGIDTGLLHVLNTAGVEHFSQFQMDMVRLGIGIYGHSSSAEGLAPVQSFKAEIAQISELQKGDHLGYGLHTVMKRDSRIATINVGYADGYRRSLGNGLSQVWVKGHRCPTIGNICMDMFFVDITDIYDIHEGEEVEIFGEHISIAEVARWADTIPYEIMTSISTRIPRIYRWE